LLKYINNTPYKRACIFLTNGVYVIHTSACSR
jgi:hypothetical protein